MDDAQQDSNRKHKDVAEWQPLAAALRESAGKPPAAADVVRRMTKKVKKTSGNPSPSLESEFRSMVYFGFDNRLSGELPPERIKQTMFIT